MGNYSYSRLDLYDGCPRAYKMRYIDKRQELPSEALERGTAVHEAVAEYARHCIDTGVKTDLDFIRSFSGTDEVRGILETYAETHLFDGGNYTVEKIWKIPLGRHMWRGVIDLMRDDGKQIFISDAKTDHRIRSQTEVNHDRQLRYYAWTALKKHPNAQEAICSIDFVRYGVTRSITYSREDMIAIEAELLKAIELIEIDTEFKARPGTRCAWCSWTETCPVIAQGELEVITGPNDAERAASSLIALKARIKSLEEMLKPWCTREGSINTNGMVVGYHTSKSVGYDTNSLIALFEGRGQNPASALKADTTAIKRLAKKDESLAASLEDIAIDKSSSRFEVRGVR
jgi:CRISPR/Cas system-associated exonuclease Cas4 (RecB family)